MSAQGSLAAVLSPPARRAMAMVIAFAAVAPAVDAAAFLGVYTIAKGVLLGKWDVPALRDVLADLPEIYSLEIGAAVLAGLVIAWCQARRGRATPLFVVVTGLFIGLVNTAILLADAPDFGQREFQVSFLLACHTVAFVLTTIVCWRLGDLFGRVVGGAAP